MEAIMAKVNSVQKKQKTSFIIMIVAIVLVALAICFVLFDKYSSTSSLLENQNFASALSSAIGKAPAFIKEEDLAKPEYVAIAYDSSAKTYTIGLGYEGFIDGYNDYMQKAENGEDTSSIDLSKFIKSASYKGENELFDDIKYFTGAKIIEASSLSFTDSSVFAGLSKLTDLTVSYCGLTEVAGLADLGNHEGFESLNIAGNQIEDYSPLEYFKDKVIVNSYYTLAQNEDGTFDTSSIIPVQQTLEQYLEELEHDHDHEDEQEEESGEESEEEPASTEDGAENGEPEDAGETSEENEAE